jgi:hypothetical protein
LCQSHSPALAVLAAARKALRPRLEASVGNRAEIAGNFCADL